MKSIISCFLLVLFYCSFSSGAVQAQIGQSYKLTASDAAESDWFGNSVSIDGNRAIVGAHLDDEQGEQAGAAYIYEWDGTTWIQTAKLMANDAEPDDQFGLSVAISGNNAIVGSLLNKENGIIVGAAYIFEWDGITWVQTAKLRANDAENGDWFGRTVSISGNRAVIGSTGDDGLKGAAYVFERNGSWTQTQKLIASDRDIFDRFGQQISISNDYVAISATGAGKGAVYVYLFNGTSWDQHAKLFEANPTDFQVFGTSVSVSGDYLIVGDSGYNTSNVGTGGAYIYERIDATWNNVAILTPDEVIYGDFGWSVSISGNRAVVGSPTENSTGVAYVYERLDDAWHLKEKLYSFDGESGDNFGTSVSISEAHVLAGASQKSDIGNDSGAAYLFNLSSPSRPETATVLSDDGAPGDRFGRSVAADGDLAVVGAERDDDAGNNSGSVYFFEWDGGNWKQTTKYSGVGDDEFYGSAVAISGNRAVVGAHADDQPETNSGAVYFYERGEAAWYAMPVGTTSDAAFDALGRSVSISGDRAIAGAPFAVNKFGAAYIYEWDGSYWVRTAVLTASDAGSWDEFGTAVSISGDRAIVGANFNDDAGNASGSAYIYEWNGTAWNETARLTASDAAPEDQFGGAVSISGDFAVVGAEKDTDGTSGSGSVYVFRWDGTNWNEIAKLRASDANALDTFGASVSLSEDRLLVGALNDEEAGIDSGSAYVFEWDGTQWSEISKLYPGDGVGNDLFGGAVSLSGGRAIVGAIGDILAADSPGKAYTYDIDGELSATPALVDFGFIDEGMVSAPMELTLTNTGLFPLDVTSVELEDGSESYFTHTFSGPVTLESGTSSTFDVTFTPPATDGLLYRVNAGGNLVEDWAEDSAEAPSPFLLPESTNIETTGDDISTDDSVPADTPLDLFASMRLDANQDAPAMEWDFPVIAGGQYEVRMYFAEMSRCKVGNRVFDVEIEDVVVLDDFDIYAEAGSACEVGVMRSHTVTAEDDTLDVNFPLVNGKPSAVSGFEIIVLSTPPTALTAQLSIEHTGINGTQYVDLTGETGGTASSSVLSVSQEDVSFGITEEGAVSEAVMLTLSNDGASPVDITQVSLAGPDSTDFTHTFTVPVTLGGGATSTVEVAFAPQPKPVAAAGPLEAEGVLFRVNAGGSLVDDWEEDTADVPSPYILAGSSSIETDGPTPTLDATVPAGTPTDLFTHKRIDANKPEPYMEWDFPVSVGSELVVNLFFVEMSRCSAGSRVFDVTIDGAVVLDDFDVYVEAGNECNQGTMRSVTVTAIDDNLDIDFPLVNGKPAVVAAIEILGGGTAVEVDTRTADLLIEHTGSNPMLSVALSGEAIPSSDTTDTGDGSNAKPVAAFTYEFVTGITTTSNTLLVDVSTDSDGEIVSRLWDVSGAAAFEDSVAVFNDPDTPFSVTLTVTDDAGETSTVTETITLSDITLTEIDGIVVFEAENYVSNDPFENHSWTEHTAVEGFSGAGAMQAQPNDGTVSNGINSTHMTYEADFTTGGTYYLWARVYAETTDDNSLHMGDNGSATAVKANQNTVGEWSWTGVNTKNNALDVDLSVGMNTIDVWMREDGLILDKLIVTTDELYAPEGLGPDESQRKGIAVATNGPDVQVAGKAEALDGLSKIKSTEEEVPGSFALHANYPNPFNPVTTIEFELPESATVRLEVFDMMGRRVATLVEQQMSAGRHQTRWDARSDSGSPVASGVYIYRMQAGSFEAVEQMILMK